MQSPIHVRDLIQPVLITTEQAGLPFEHARASALLGWAIARLGNPDQGIAMIRRGGAEMRATGAASVEAGVLTADALRNAGRYDEAVAAADEVLVEPFSWFFIRSPHILRLKGEAILGCNPSATSDAEQCFRKAIEIAKANSAKWWELHATVSLARLLRDTDRRDGARAMLEEIYGWFTEGFDTAELKDAEALLEELSSPAA
jgi:adenylate cyclase